jgi:hypothetical protein
MRPLLTPPTHTPKKKNPKQNKTLRPGVGDKNPSLLKNPKPIGLQFVVFQVIGNG